MKTTIIFDLDGTLIDSRADLAAAVNTMLNHFNYQSYPLDTICSFVGDGIVKLVERSIDGTDIQLEPALKVMKDAYTKDVCVHTKLYDGVETGLQRLREAGIPIAIATNKIIDCTESILEKLDIAHYFDHIIGDGSGFERKPSPDGLTHILRETGAEASSSWMVGDHHTDIISGRNAGLKTVFLAYGIGDAMGEEYDKEFDNFGHTVDFLIKTHNETTD